MVSFYSFCKYFSITGSGISFLVVSGLKGPDQMDRPYFISNTHCEVSLVVLINPSLFPFSFAMIN